MNPLQSPFCNYSSLQICFRVYLLSRSAFFLTMTENVSDLDKYSHFRLRERNFDESDTCQMIGVSSAATASTVTTAMTMANRGIFLKLRIANTR